MLHILCILFLFASQSTDTKGSAKKKPKTGGGGKWKAR